MSEDHKVFFLFSVSVVSSNLRLLQNVSSVDASDSEDSETPRFVVVSWSEPEEVRPSLNLKTFGPFSTEEQANKFLEKCLRPRHDELDAIREEERVVKRDYDEDRVEPDEMLFAQEYDDHHLESERHYDVVTLFPSSVLKPTKESKNPEIRGKDDTPSTRKRKDSSPSQTKARVAKKQKELT